MAKKKTKKQTEEEAEVLEENTTDFDWTRNWTKLEKSKMYKNGLKAFILSNNPTIKNEKEFQQAIQDYENLSM